jgi:hypothetical protein
MRNFFIGAIRKLRFMNNSAVVAVFAVAGGFLAFSSCSGLPFFETESPSASSGKKTVQETPKAVELAPETASSPPEQFVPWEDIDGRPRPSEYIMGEGLIPKEKLAAFLLQRNNWIDEDFALLLSGYYVEEAAIESVNHDIAFAQMCLETGFLHYGGLVTPDMNNFCGLGAIGPEKGLFFPDPRTGVRAHIQHLQAYASTEPLKQELVDPRYRYVKRGSSPTINGLSGTWAVDRSYDMKIGRILRNLYEFSF